MTHLPFSTDAVLESLGDGFQAFDREWRYVYLNRRAERILGRRREELIGRVCWEEYPEAVGTEFHRNYLRAMSTGKPVVFEFFCPHDSTWVEFSLHPYPGWPGRIYARNHEPQAGGGVRSVRANSSTERFSIRCRVPFCWRMKPDAILTPTLPRVP
jgi:PAS domain S-box-containing protein